MSSYGTQQLQQHQKWREARERLWSPSVRVNVPPPAQEAEPEPEPEPIVSPEPVAPPEPDPSATDTREAQLIALQEELRTLAVHIRQARERVEQALSDQVPLVRPCPSVRSIVRTVAVFYQISVDDILSHRRTAQAVYVRHVAMYLAKQLTLCSLPEIGRRFGGRDHSTVHHAVWKITKLRQTDSDLDKQLTELTALLTLKDEQP